MVADAKSKEIKARKLLDDAMKENADPAVSEAVKKSSMWIMGSVLSLQ